MNEYRSVAPPADAPRRAASGILALVILELTAATAYVHLTLGSTIFLLNGIGYVALGLAFALAVAGPTAMIRRFSWLPRVALAGYTLATIVAYLVVGPYFALGWITKAMEVAIVGLLAVDVIDVYGGLAGLAGAIKASLSPRLPSEGAGNA